MRWRCSRCGEEHEDLPLDLAFDAPTYWDGGRGERDRLTEDVCTWTDDAGRLNYFVRCILPLPIVGHDERFAYGVWASLSEANFERFLALYDDPTRVDEPPYFGWLSNVLPDYPDTLNLRTDVVIYDASLRPKLVLHDAAHPLVRHQREGITLDRVRSVVERALHPA